MLAGMRMSGQGHPVHQGGLGAWPLNSHRLYQWLLIYMTVGCLAGNPGGLQVQREHGDQHVLRTAGLGTRPEFQGTRQLQMPAVRAATITNPENSWCWLSDWPSLASY